MQDGDTVGLIIITSFCIGSAITWGLYQTYYKRTVKAAFKAEERYHRAIGYWLASKNYEQASQQIADFYSGGRIGPDTPLYKMRSILRTSIMELEEDYPSLSKLDRDELNKERNE